jgi:hypothetical protein
LENDADGNGFPDCWQPNGWGVNTSTWRMVGATDAHTGSVAERVDVTGYTSGQVRLLSQQDLGYCAATATAGNMYKLGAWYRGSVQPRLVAFYRNAVGAWNVLGQSDHRAQSAGWAHATWTTPALPSGANGIAMAVAVDSVGWLTMDDLTIVDAGPVDGSQ